MGSFRGKRVRGVARQRRLHLCGSEGRQRLNQESLDKRQFAGSADEHYARSETVRNLLVSSQPVARLQLARRASVRQPRVAAKRSGVATLGHGPDNPFNPERVA